MLGRAKKVLIDKGTRHNWTGRGKEKEYPRPIGRSGRGRGILDVRLRPREVQERMAKLAGGVADHPASSSAEDRSEGSARTGSEDAMTPRAPQSKKDIVASSGVRLLLLWSRSPRQARSQKITTSRWYRHRPARASPIPARSIRTKSPALKQLDRGRQTLGQRATRNYKVPMRTDGDIPTW